MAQNFRNNKDSTEIAELAALNEDISDDMLEQLSMQLTGNNTHEQNDTVVNKNDDSTLFEETNQPSDESNIVDSTPEETAQTIEPKTENPPAAEPPATQEEITANVSAKKEEITVNKSFDDNFIKKYKAKLNKKAGKTDVYQEVQKTTEPVDNGEPIEDLSQGKISERPLTQELKDYNDSLDFLDGNVKYSKYVIYIDPQNVDFIEHLTVKERKNLINEILRQQDDISITKRRFRVIQNLIRHIVIAILTLSISIPLVYYAINASLEATIDNHRRSQTNWQALYKEHGKISQQ